MKLFSLRFTKTFLPGLVAMAALLGAGGGASLQAAPSSSLQIAAVDKMAESRATQIFRQLGVLESDAVQERARVIPPAAQTVATTATTANRLAIAAATPAPITFQFTGYSASEKSTLQNFLSNNYNRIVTLWGAPAPEQAGKTVQVIGNDIYDAAYVPPATASSGGGTIYFKYVNYATNSEVKNTYNFTRLVLPAFEGPRIPSYEFLEGRYVEPWLYGAADAGALIIAYQAAGSPANFDPSSLGAYVLPVYDFFNRPELGNAFIYSPSGTDVVVSDFRLSMAQAAFLKLYIEKPTFFSEFNSALYSAIPARSAISPDQLRDLAAGVVSQVEGLKTRDWLRRQYALDCSVTTGQKLYVALLPVPASTTGDTRYGFSGFAQAFTTSASGDETASSGLGSVNAYDETGRDIRSFSSELTNSNVLNFNDPDFPGQAILGGGFSNFGSPAPALVTLKLRYREAEATTYFPFGVAGTTGSSAAFYGATLGATSGTLQLSGSVNEAVPVARSVFRSTSTYPSGPRVQTTLTFGVKTLKRNTAWLKAGANARGVAFLLDVADSTTNFNFSTPGGISSLRMISLPFFPLESDEADILNLDPDTLKLARYRPNLAPLQRNGDALKFGIAADRHELYPYINEPMEPGRGYWLGKGAYSTTIPGKEPSHAQNFEVPLKGGWNQFGVPFNRSYAPNSVKVRYGGFAPVSLQVAQTRGWLAAGVWRWLPGGGYSRVDDGSSTQLQPYEGYFIFAVPERGVSLVFEPAATLTALALRDGWSVNLQATGLKSKDKAARFGVSKSGDIAGPPPAAQVVTVRFDGDDTAAQAGSGLAELYLSELQASGSWAFTVDGANLHERITLSWGNLKSVPSGIKLTLLDEATGRRLLMKPNGVYHYTATGQPAHFMVEATRIVRANLTAVAAKSFGTYANLTLDAPANGRLEVKRIGSSETIATLFDGELSQGKTQFLWDGKNSVGTAESVGSYQFVWSFTGDYATNGGDEANFRLR